MTSDWFTRPLIPIWTLLPSIILYFVVAIVRCYRAVASARSTTRTED